MLGKLLKRELKSYRLQVGITFLVAAIITVFMKVISMLPMKDPDGKIFLQMFTYMGYTYLIALVGVALQIFVITRFYNTMLSDRAYLVKAAWWCDLAVDRKRVCHSLPDLFPGRTLLDTGSNGSEGYDEDLVGVFAGF